MGKLQACRNRKDNVDTHVHVYIFTQVYKFLLKLYSITHYNSIHTSPNGLHLRFRDWIKKLILQTTVLLLSILL